MTDMAFSKIGIVGTGKMASGIFYLLRDFNYHLVWIARSEKKQQKLTKKFNKKLKRAHKVGIIDEETYSYRIDSTLISADRKDLGDCDLMIEAIVEDREIKAGLFKELDAVVNEACVFASSTSSMRPDSICPSEQRAGNFAGLHFFYPVQYSTLLEIMGCGGGSTGTVERLRKFGQEIGKNPLVLPEQGAFILNKLASYVNNIAVWVYTERILTYKEIDELMKKHLFTMGAFEFADSVGIDTIVATTKVYMGDMDHTDYFTRSIETSKEVTDKGDLGIKAGKGWYSYTAGVEDEPWRPVQPMGDEEREKYKEAAVERMVCVYVNMCYDAVSRGYLTEEEVETAMEAYSGVEKGPGRLAKEFGGLKAIHEMLLRYRDETGWGVYRPCAFIDKKVRSQ